MVILATLVSGAALAEDVHRIKNVGDIAMSPDGEWIAYGVESTNLDKDESSSDLFMVNWDGSTRIQLTHTEDSSESNPRFSPDGTYLAFIAARTDGSPAFSSDGQWIAWSACLTCTAATSGRSSGLFNLSDVINLMGYCPFVDWSDVLAGD